MTLSSKLLCSIGSALVLALLPETHAQATGPTYAIGDSKLETSEALLTSEAALGYGLALADKELIATSYKFRMVYGAYVFSPTSYGPKKYLETAKLINPEAGNSSYFGASVAAQGKLVAIGAPSQDVRVGSLYAYTGGIVHLFQRDPAGWTEIQQLNASDAKYDDQFGNTVAIDGNTMVIGSRAALYVFDRNQAGSWIESKKLVPTTTRSTSGFGSVVSISGDLIAAGAGQFDSSNQPPGSVFLFERNSGGAGNWGQTKTLEAPDGPSDNRFGSKLDLEGDRLAVAALRADSALNPTGAVHIFERNQGGTNGWGAVAKVTSGTGTFDQFGRSVNLSGDLLVVGAPYGFRAYAFDRTGSGANAWVRSQAFAPYDQGRDNQTGYGFGGAVAIGEDKIFIAATVDPTSGLNRGGGAVYTFNRTRTVPVFGRLPEHSVRQPGQAVTFSAPATGPGTLSYQWRFNGQDLPGKNSSTLDLTNLVVEQSGFYTAVVKNAFGSAETPPTQLTVAPVPGIPAVTTTQADGGASTGEQYTMGFSFSTTEALKITHLGCLDIVPDGTLYPVEIGLWNRQTGQLLARSMITPPGTSGLLSGGHRYLPITPVTLQPGTQYVVGVFTTFVISVKSSTNGVQIDPAIQVQGSLVSRDLTMKMPADASSGNTGRSLPGFLFSRSGVAALEVADGTGAGGALLDGRGGEKLDLAAAAIGTPGAARTLQIRNPGDAPLTLSQPLLPAGVELAEALPASIPAGGSALLSLRLNSPVPGSYGGEVTFASNVAHRTPFSFSVQGSVVVPELALELSGPAAVPEDGIATLGFRVSRTGPVNAPLRVLLSASGTAVPAEYTLTGATAQEVILPAGSAITEWSALPLEDRLEEQDETLAFELQADPLYSIAATKGRAEGTILNDDYSPVTVAGPLREVPENGRLEVNRANGVLVGASDLDDAPETLTAELVDTALHGSLELRADGSFVYQPTTAYHGPDEFTFRASDGVNHSALTRVSIQVIEEVDLQLAVAESSDPVLAGFNEPVWHRYTLVNAGPSTATGIEIALTRTLPPAVTSAASAPTSGEFDGSVWRLATLAPGASAELLLPFSVPAEVVGGSSILKSSAQVQAVQQPLILTNDDLAKADTSILSPASMSFLGREASAVLNRQNGLLVHRITVTNDNPAAIGPFRVVITGLPAGIVPQGASGTTPEGYPYFLIEAPLAAGGRLDLGIEYYSPNRSTAFVPQYRLELLRPTPPPAALSGTRFSIDHCSSLPDGTFLIEWSSVPGTRYAVEYSGNLSDWTQAGDPVTAAANRTQWVDSGPPKTPSKPSASGLRYYRIVTLGDAPR